VDLGTEGEKKVNGREETIPSRSSLGSLVLIEVVGELHIMSGFS
jgi:hypothetical protein